MKSRFLGVKQIYVYMYMYIYVNVRSNTFCGTVQNLQIRPIALEVNWDTRVIKISSRRMEGVHAVTASSLYGKLANYWVFFKKIQQRKK